MHEAKSTQVEHHTWWQLELDDDTMITREQMSCISQAENNENIIWISFD
jgi:hypothetical protein